MTTPTIDKLMTRAPYTIRHDATLQAAHELMRANHIRHLPVLESGKLVGIVSQRDLHLIETLKDVEPDQVQVNEAMTTEIFAVGPSASLHKVALAMAKHKYGSAIVVEKNRVVGVFTTSDALAALASLAAAHGKTGGAKAPSPRSRRTVASRRRGARGVAVSASRR